MTNSSRELTSSSFISGGTILPLIIEPSSSLDVDLVSWGAARRHFIEAQLLQYGGLLFRNFKVNSVEAFADFIKAVAGDALEYHEYSTPRTKVARHIYTSTDYPAEQPIFLHNESSYRQTWPMKIFFFCDMPAIHGGETPLADVRKVLRRIDPQITDRFAQKGWMYIRNFGGIARMPWQTFFQTSDRTAVEWYCRENNIQLEWRNGDRLRISAVRKAITKHPHTKEPIWFNHATVFHLTTIKPHLREGLLKIFPEEELPINSYYGDGSPIETEVMETLRNAHKLETVSFPWQRGDILMLDNMLVAHGRSSYVGDRKILVGMADPFTPCA